jgi:dolichyl-phosphate-mannose-protein mannosyltransferase
LSLDSFLIERRFELIVLLLVAISLGTRFYSLDLPDSYYFDEVYFAFTAQEMAKGNTDVWEGGWKVYRKAPKPFKYEWSHPPLGKELITLGIFIFGDNTFGWRFFQALFGGLATLFLYILGKDLFQSKRIGLFAAFLYTFDSFGFVLSRIAMVDIFLLNFIILASLFLVKYGRSQKSYFLILSGSFCGLAMSVKWSGVCATGFLAAIAFILAYYSEVYTAPDKGSSFLLSTFKVVLKIIIFFIIVPLAVYVTTYIPYFLYGYGLDDFFVLQLSMFFYHKQRDFLFASSLVLGHPRQSPWWTWPLLLRPVWLYLGDYEDKHRYIYLIGNPFIWWTGCVFFLVGIVQVIRTRLPSIAFAVLSVFAYWLPWALSPRKMTFIYHFLPSFIFILLIIAYFLDLIWNRSRYGKEIVILYLLVAVGMFIYFYPITAAVPIAVDTLGRYFWIRGWR